jgi:hypothetical protein
LLDLVKKIQRTHGALAKLLRAHRGVSACSIEGARVAFFGGTPMLWMAAIYRYVKRLMLLLAGIGTVLSCIPGRLAYYEAEDAGERYIFSR